MARGQKRMISTAIWEDEAFTKLCDKAKILYIGLITVADDDGRLRGNSVLLRSQIFPTDAEVTIDDIRSWLNTIVRAKLIVSYKENGEYFLQHPNWEEYQVIRADLYKASKFPQHPEYPALRSRNVHETEKHPKVIKVKLSKDKIKEENSISYLSKIPEEHMKEFLERFDVSKSKILDKAEAFLLYCKSKGELYKDYKSALLNAMKKDFPKREQRNTTAAEPLQQKEKISIPQSMKDEISKIVGAKSMK